jgi:CRP-like cAMP-binding protein
MSYATRDRSFNRLLASLPPEDNSHLESIGRLEHPHQGRILTSRSASVTDLWFPHAGVVALTVTDATGRSVQTGLIGSEGCVGSEALFDHSAPLPDAIVQIDGPMFVIPAHQMRSALCDRPPIQAALSRFLYGLSLQSLQTVACNRQHSLLARCCRWLLTIQDRVASDELPLTQENLAVLLGSGRPRVNGLLATLERKGLIRRHRGRLRLLTRTGLKASACDCYPLVKSVLTSLDYGSG